MKTKIFKAIMLSGLLISLDACDDNKERPVEPRVAGNENQREFSDDNDKDWDVFRVDAESRINYNDRKIIDLEARSSDSKNDANEQYNKRISDLKERNNKLRIRVKNYKKDGNQKWDEFKREFNRDMNELGKSLEDFTENHTK